VIHQFFSFASTCQFVSSHFDVLYMYSMVPDVPHQDVQVPQWVLPAVMHKARISLVPSASSSADSDLFSRKLGLLRHQVASTLIPWMTEVLDGTPVRQ
jgi:hypothetical protein